MFKTITPEYLASQGLSPTFEKRFWRKVDKNGPVQKHCPEFGPCWNWKGSVQKWGYGRIGRWKPGDTAIGAHVASWILHFGPVPNGLCVLHKCDNPPCSNPDHLFTGTQAENTQDKMRKGRYKLGERKHGEQNSLAKLTQAHVMEIRLLYGAQFTYERLAGLFKVSKTLIAKIVRREVWRHI